MPAIDLNGTSPVELLEQHELAIAGLWSAISTLAATAPDARHYPARKPGTFQQAQAEHRDRLARLESVMDELEQLAEFEELADLRIRQSQLHAGQARTEPVLRLRHAKQPLCQSDWRDPQTL